MDHASGPADDKDVEDRATRFAGEFLAPYEMIRGTLRRVSTSDLRPLFERSGRVGRAPEVLGVPRQSPRRHR